MSTDQALEQAVGTGEAPRKKIEWDDNVRPAFAPDLPLGIEINGWRLDRVFDHGYLFVRGASMEHRLEFRIPWARFRSLAEESFSAQLSQALATARANSMIRDLLREEMVRINREGRGDARPDRSPIAGGRAAIAEGEPSDK